MQYVALFEKEKNGYSVEFPDFPGCVTCGDDLDEAVDMAHEALAMFVEGMLEDGESLPEPSGKKELLSRAEYTGRKALNVTAVGDGSDFVEFEAVMHGHLLGRVEKYCKVHGVSPADFLAVAARIALKEDVYGD